MKRWDINNSWILMCLLYRILEWVLKSIQHLCYIEDKCIKDTFKKYGFHPAICVHPSILYEKDGTHNRGGRFAISLKVAYLRKAIRVGLLKTDKGHGILQPAGVPRYYWNGLEFWFVESHTPIVPYNTPIHNAVRHKVVVYTALTGDYDNVNEMLYKEEGVDYLLFTNNKSLKSKTWQIVYVDSDLDNVLLSREIKMLPHKYLGDRYAASIYIDANAVIYGELSQLAHYLSGDVKFAVSRHSERVSVREEIDALVQIKHMDFDIVIAQYNRYINEGFKDDLGLAECGVLVRNHNDEGLQKVMNAWWTEFQNGIRRDQISLLPMMDKLQYTDWQYMQGNIWHNQYFKIISHKQ